jgi:hypothetical protein
MTRCRSIKNVFTDALAIAVVALMFGVVAPLTYAEESTSTSSVTVKEEKLEKDVKKFMGKEMKKLDERAIANRIAMVERRIAELKKHIEHYELLLIRLKAPAGSMSTTTKQDIKKRLQDYASSTKAKRGVRRPTGEVQGVSTTMPVVPVCRIKLDKPWYVVGDEIKVSWTSTGATYAEFVVSQSDVGKDGLTLPADKLAANGTQSIEANVLGLPTLIIKVTSSTGRQTFCSRSLAILPAGATASDKRLAPLLAQMKQLGINVQRLSDQEQKILQSKIKIVRQMVELQQKIDAILGAGGGTSEDRASLQFRTGPGNPDAMAIVVSKDDETEATLLEYTITAKGEDVQLNQLAVKLTSSAPLAKVIEVDDVFLVVDGQTFDSENVPTNSTRSFVFKYDIDGDVYLDEGESLTVKVLVTMSPQGEDPAYPQNTTLRAEVGDTERNLTLAESVHDLIATDMSGVVVGETHSLLSSGAIVDSGSFEDEFETSGENDTVGRFTMSYDITAIGDDVYVPKTAARGRVDTTVGVNYRVETGGATSSMKVTHALSSTAEDTGTFYKVDEGTTETFTLTITVDPTMNGAYRVQLIQFNWNNVPSTSGLKTQLLLPVTEYRSEWGIING